MSAVTQELLSSLTRRTKLFSCHGENGLLGKARGIINERTILLR